MDGLLGGASSGMGCEGIAATAAGAATATAMMSGRESEAGVSGAGTAAAAAFRVAAGEAATLGLLRCCFGVGGDSFRSSTSASATRMRLAGDGVGCSACVRGFLLGDRVRGDAAAGALLKL